MFVRFDETALEQFSSSQLTPWTPPWQGSRKLFMVTFQFDRREQFIAYGTDGSVAFRVQGSVETDLAAFREIMANWRAEEVPAVADLHEEPAGDDLLTGGTPIPCDVIIQPPTFPCIQSVQQALDTELGTSIAA